MLYIYKKFIEDAGYEGDYEIVVCAKDNNGDFHDTQELLTNPAIRNLVKLTGSTFGLAAIPSFKAPVLLSTGGSIDVSSVRNLVIQNGGVAIQSEVSQVIANKLVELGFTKEDAIAVVCGCITQLKYESLDQPLSNMNISVEDFHPTFLEETSNLMNSLNFKNVCPFSQITLDENKTLYQQTCEDELFIKLPDLQIMKSDDYNIQQYLPTAKVLSDPYGANTLEDMSQYKDPTSGFPSFKYHLVEGDVANNTTEIKENEKKFYTALIEWIQFNLRQTYGQDTNVDLSNSNLDIYTIDFLEHLAKRLYQLYWNQNLNIPEDSFLDDDSDDDSDSNGTESNYVFRPSAEEKSLISQGFSDVSAANTKHINALEVLASYLKTASLQIGYRAYVEAIIQLARWGERKGTHIELTDYPIVFELATNKTKDNLGSIDDYEVALNNGFEYTASFCIADDNALKGNGVYANGTDLPIGLILEKTLVHKKDSSKVIKSSIYISLIDFIVNQLSDNPISVANINVKDTITVQGDIDSLQDVLSYDMLLSQYEIEKDTLLQEPFYVSPTLQAAIFSIKSASVNSIKLNHFSVHNLLVNTPDLVNRIEEQSFTTNDEFNLKRRSRVIYAAAEAISLNVGKKLLPIYQYVDAHKDTINSLTDLLTLYKEALYTTNYKGEFFMTDSDSVTISLSSNNSANITNTVSSMTAFSDTPQTKSEANLEQQSNLKQTEENTPVEESSESTQQVETEAKDTTTDTAPNTSEDTSEEAFSSLCRPLDLSGRVCKLVDSSRQVIGGLVINEKLVTLGEKTAKLQTYHLFDISAFEEVCKDLSQEQINSMPVLSYYKILPAVFQTLYALESHAFDLLSVYFKDKQTISYFKDLFKKHVSILDNMLNSQK